MSLKSIIDAELSKRGKTFKWLVKQVGISHDGLKGGLENESIRLRDLKKLIDVLDLPIQFFFEPGSTFQSIAGKHNTQMANNLLSEPESEYRKIEVQGLRKQVQMLEQQLKDKERIIELLSKHN